MFKLIILLSFETQEIIRLFNRLVSSSPLGPSSFVTQFPTPIGSNATSQSPAKGPRSSFAPNTCSWNLDLLFLHI
jgi:hypothetical protein